MALHVLLLYLQESQEHTPPDASEPRRENGLIETNQECGEVKQVQGTQSHRC